MHKRSNLFYSLFKISDFLKLVSFDGLKIWVKNIWLFKVGFIGWVTFDGFIQFPLCTDSVTCHVSHVTCHLSFFSFLLLYKLVELKFQVLDFWRQIFLKTEIAWTVTIFLCTSMQERNIDAPLLKLGGTFTLLPIVTYCDLLYAIFFILKTFPPSNVLQMPPLEQF